MIISHRHSFIFFKPMKVAGSSIEVSLRPGLGADDIQTGSSYSKEISSKDYEYAPKNNFNLIEMPNELILEPIFSSHTTPTALSQNYKEWKNIQNYFKFSAVRNPWDLCVSYFWWSFNNYKVIDGNQSERVGENIAPMSYDTPTVLRIKLQSFFESPLHFLK